MGLKEYTRTRPSGPESFRQEYSRSFLLAVHHVLFEAVKRLKKRLLTEYDEVAITGALVKELNTVVASPKTRTWGFLLAVHDDPPIDIGAKKGKLRPRVDIQIEKVNPGPRARFSFEAKRLRQSSSLSEYVGEEGLECFVSGRYAAYAPFGGMLGYIESGTAEDWISSIGAKIAQMPRLNCSAKEHWNVPDFPFAHVPCRCSHHRRPDQTDILVLHSFIDLRRALSRPTNKPSPAQPQSARA